MSDMIKFIAGDTNKTWNETRMLLTSKQAKSVLILITALHWYYIEIIGYVEYCNKFSHRWW